MILNLIYHRFVGIKLVIMDKLLISFSGGLTSAFMTKWCLDNLSDRYEMLVVFANTGKEREETLDFVRECDEKFGFNSVWVEAVVNMSHGKGVSARVVDFDSASRDGRPFEDVIRKYGLPNVKFPSCTRELKLNTIRSYARSIGWKGYYTAIGIRVDEVDRISPDRIKKKFIYPLVSMVPMGKSDIYDFWDKQDFRLNLKTYEGNCDLCFKKSDRKLMTILLENPGFADWWRDIEVKYGHHLPWNKNKEAELPVRIFRQGRSVDDLLWMSENLRFDRAIDESRVIARYKQLSFDFDIDLSNGCSESCEVF